MALNDLPCLGCDTQGGCGTGTGNWPKPGDPSNNSVLTAVPAFGGVDVSWTYPDVNPQAVQHTLLYRAYSNDFNAAAIHAVVAGNFFYDKNPSEVFIEYFYWIQIVSVNGTYGEVIGPASATPKPTIQEVIEGLTGKIDNGVLSQSLKQEIDRIQVNDKNISDEIRDRILANQALTAALGETNANVDQAITYINDEIIKRVEGQDALLSRINTLAVGNLDLQAAIQEEATVRATADSALASRITQTETTFGDNLAQAKTELRTEISTVDGKVVAIGALYTAQVNVNGLVGGFGIYNDGTTVEAGFDVDRFWIGRTGANKRKPFIIENDVVYMDDAVINKLTFDKLRAADGSLIVANGKIQAQYLEVGTLIVNEAQSKNYVAGVSGWKLFSNGDYDFNGSNAAGRSRMTPTLTQIWDANGVLRVRMGLW